MKHRLQWMCRVGFVFLLAVTSSMSTGIAFVARACAQPLEEPLQIGQNALQQIQGLQVEKALRTPAQRRIDSQLIYALKITQQDPFIKGVPTLRSSVEIAPDGTTLVDIKAKVTAALLEEIEQLGGSVIKSIEEYDSIRARIPLEQTELLAERPDIRFIGPALRFITDKVNTSEGDVAHNAALARSTFGVDGTGIKVGVISDSVDHLADVQASGDLPAVTVLEDSPGLTGEGTAVLEIIHDLAPGADLYFATADFGQGNFAKNILGLRLLGCDIIIDDIGYLGEFPFQDDIIAEAVNWVTADGAVYFSAAGNSGNLNDGQSGTWEGDFSGLVDPSLPSPLNLLIAHDFGGGDTTNEITRDSPFSFWLFWSDPLWASGNDYDLYLLNPAGDTILAASDNAQDGNDLAAEAIDSGGWDDTGNLLVIVQFSGDDRFLHLRTNRGRLEHGTAGAIIGHGAAADAFAVAAVNAQGMTSAFDGSESVETFCSDGPRRVFYHHDGTPITPGDFSSTGGEVRETPDLTAADGVETATPGFERLYGTSAGASHAAGIGALLLSMQPSLTPAQARSALTDTALDIESPGWDRDSGAGIVMADLAISSIMVKVPHVTGISQGDAGAAIEAAGLTLGAATEEYSATVPAGDVIDQDPAGDTSVPLNTAIDLVISLGPGIMVPDIVGTSLGDAVAAINAAGFRVGTADQEYSLTVPLGDVIGQEPAGGTFIPPGSAVNLLSSLGREIVGAPDVVGMSQGNAVAAIHAAGLSLGTVAEQYSFAVPAGDVISQDPEGGTLLLAGSTVDLLVSLGGRLATQCSALGEITPGQLRLSSPLDYDAFRFYGEEGEAIVVNLEPDASGTHTGNYASLAVRGPFFLNWNIARTLARRGGAALPCQVTLTLPTAGEYRIEIEQTRSVLYTELFRGEYCLTLESSGEAADTLAPLDSVE